MRYYDFKSKTFNVKDGFKEGITSFFIQFVILIFVILTFILLFGGKFQFTNLMNSNSIHGEETNPSSMRLIFSIVTIILGMICGYVADKKSESNVTQSFWFAIIGGILLWQAIGECSWHFGIQSGESMLYFPRLESAESLYLVIFATIFLLYCNHKDIFSFGMWTFLISFYCNWIGHFCMIGTYPLVDQLMEEDLWLKISGAIFGSLLTLYSIYLMFVAAKDKRGRLLASLYMYTGVGVFVTGVTGV